MNHKLTDGIIKANAALKCINLMGLQISIQEMNISRRYPWRCGNFSDSYAFPVANSCACGSVFECGNAVLTWRLCRFYGVWVLRFP